MRDRVHGDDAIHGGVGGHEPCGGGFGEDAVDDCGPDGLRFVHLAKQGCHGNDASAGVSFVVAHDDERTRQVVDVALHTNQLALGCLDVAALDGDHDGDGDVERPLDLDDRGLKACHRAVVWECQNNPLTGL